MSKKTKTNFISASVKRVRSLTLLVTGGVVMSSMALALLLQDTASSNNENVQVWGVQSRVQYLTGMTLSWANNNHIKFEYKEGTNSLNLNAAVNLHALILGASNSGANGATVIGGHDNKVQGNWKNAAIIGGSNNTTNDTTSSIIAGSKGSSITKAGESAIFSAQGTIVGGENPTDTVFIVWGQNHITTNASTVFIAGAERIQTTKSHNVLIGKNIRSDQENIFAWSDTQLAPEKGNAFYVSASNGFGLNTNNPSVALDISNGGLAFNKVYQLSDLADVKEPWVILMVAKDGKQGICAYNGTTWVPLSLNAEREWLCVGNTQPARPIHVLRESVAISGAVANGSAVLTNGVTSLPQVWSKIANGNRWGWENHPWTYKHTGTLNDGEYRCGIGYHMGNPTPDGMKNTNCSSCTPITNQRDWRSNGKNNDCEFSCKAGFKKVGRSCDTCEVWTYSVNGTTANSCASCTNKPANSHYTSNGTSATSCTWACDAGYHNVGWVCKKAVWKPTVTPTCKAYPGKWKDALKVTTYSCALQEDPSVVVPENICTHWSTKPTNQTVAFADENCNPPEWETTWDCPNPSCNTSRIAGKCGGATEEVTCTQHKRDRAWNSYESRTQSQQKACTRVCETAACGAANGVATKYQPTALCAAGTASAVGGNASVWSWTCTQLDGAKNCSANRLPLQAGSCGSSHNINHNTLNAGSANLCNYGAVINFNENTAIYANRWSWKCRGDNGAHNQDANCIAHKPAPQAGQCAQALNTCTVGTVKDATNIANGKRWSCEGLHGWSTDTTCSLCDDGYEYNSATNRCDPKCGAGYTLHAGICVKWACVTASTSPKLWWARPADTEMPRGWMSLFSVSAWSLYEWPQWSRWTHSFQWPRWPQWSRSPAPKWPSETSEGPLEHGRPKGPKGPKGPERAPFQPPVHVTQQYQWPSWPRKPQQSPTWLNKTAKCVDDKWNIHPDSLCVNAGPKPECGSTSATTPPLQQCSVGFTLNNGKCVKWECKKDTAAPLSLVPLGNCTGRAGKDSFSNILCNRRRTDKTFCEKNILCEWKEWPTSSSEVWICKTKTSPILSPALAGYPCREELSSQKVVSEEVYMGKTVTEIVRLPSKKKCTYEVPLSHYEPNQSLFCEEMETRQECLKNSNCDWKRVETVSGKAAKCVDSEWNTVQESNCNNAWVKPSCNKECSPWFSRYKGKCVAWRCSIWECKYALTWDSWTCRQMKIPYVCTRSPHYNCKREWTASPVGNGQGVSWCLSEVWLRLPDTQCDPAKKSELNCGPGELI